MTDLSQAPLRVSSNRRYLVDARGEPFFWLADTAWSIVWKGTPDQWTTYLDRRAAQGFSVLQVTLLPWRWEYVDVAGNRPFHDGDPDRPNDAYFRRYDAFLELAAERGLFTCLMLIWGGPRPLLPAVHFTTPQAIAFARYAVERFSRFPMVWSLSGDAEYVTELAKWDAVGVVVEETDPFGHPTTNHLPPSLNWHAVHHDAPWHDFHMLQTGHRRAAKPEIADLPAAYYKLEPVKPVVNGEPWYEAHPAMDDYRSGEPYGSVCPPEEARAAFWTSVLSGATMGHTYGSQGIWNWKQPGDSEEHIAGPQIGPTWDVALAHAGAEHCGIGATFLRLLPWWRLQPAPERVQLDPDPVLAPRRACCAIVPDEAWVVYLPASSGAVTLKGIKPASWRAAWFDPRRGTTADAGPVDVGLDHKWQAPRPPTAEDWVLVLRCPEEDC